MTHRPAIAVALLLAAAYSQDVKPSGKFINGGTPGGVPPTFDCKTRYAAYEYGKYLLPKHGAFRTLFEALQLQECNLETPAEIDTFTPPQFPTPDAALYVSSTTGADSNPGTEASPFKTIAAAVLAAKSGATIVLRKGTYHTDTVLIDAEKNGLTLQNYNGEAVTVSGGVPLNLKASDWKKDPRMKGRWVTSALAGSDITEITGMRIDGNRSIRAKYPNGNMELSGNWLSGAGASMGGGDYTKGWVPLSNHTQWVPPFRHPDAEDVVANNADWPSVNWPYYEGSQTGEGDKGDFHIGVGGYCQDDLQDPLVGPTGYWCAMAPPRGQCWDKKTNTGRGCTQTHMSPDGVVWERAANYSDPTTGVVLSWRGGGRWFSQMWKVDHFVSENTTLIFDPTTGGQGGEGMTNSGQWWIENILEECDSPNEFFFDEKTKELYYFFNETSDMSADLVATQTRVLFNLTGTMSNPVKDITIRGLTMRDTRITYLDPHGMPSGGDWALQRSGAVFLQGTEGVTVDSNEMVRLDGNAVMLSAYNRNATISNNDVSWNGDTAFAAWGITGKCVNENCTRKLDWPVGPDGRNGEQPRFTSVVGNMVRELGIWQKQSSMWFQAVTAQTHLAGNVHFNGPRAGFNFNDGFGGADVIEHNLLANCVRESGDHGPWNSWDRIPYITDVPDVEPDTLPPTRDTKPSVIPAWRHIRHNFIMSVYSSQEAIDTDDGSAYYQTYENFFAYAANGLKSDFNGHDNRHFRNVYGYVSNCWGNGENNWFVNNTCVSNEADGGFRSDCGKNEMGKLSGNHIYNANGDLGKNSKMCDKTNTIAKSPSDDTIIGWGKKVIGWQ